MKTLSREIEEIILQHGNRGMSRLYQIMTPGFCGRAARMILGNRGVVLIGTGFPFKEPELVPRYLREFQRVLPASGGIRRGGSAALDLCYLAEGILEGFWEEDYLSPWDVAAGLVVLQEAGGLATRIDGSEIDLKNGSILAANSLEVMEELGALVRGP